MLKLWNLSLIFLTFGLTLFGTFLTRSGIIGSVHSFTQGSIGIFFLGFLALVLLGSFSLLASRVEPPARRGRARLRRLARVHVPPEQPVPRRRRLHGLLRDGLPAPVRSGARSQDQRGRTLLQPGQHSDLPRPALPDGRGTTHRVAPRVGGESQAQFPQAGARGHRGGGADAGAGRGQRARADGDGASWSSSRAPSPSTSFARYGRGGAAATAGPPRPWACCCARTGATAASSSTWASSSSRSEWRARRRGRCKRRSRCRRGRPSSWPATTCASTGSRRRRSPTTPRSRAPSR